ncbi:solute carrier family 22 member 8 [Galendromus occidentalis]|uniref:Solute carrier family 22 member 8 n=1 Tax=Galendromus occidentalis TaxID=34638 RepID=A0AAJ6VWG0_9ACAR|nr:solute carrier family 22 member 8 [Galendromus occidentalis]
MTFEDDHSALNELVGGFSNYHVLLFVMIAFRAVPSGWNELLVHLVTPKLQHWCAPYSGFNQTSWKSYAIPADPFGGLEQCTQYHLDSFYRYGHFHYPDRYAPRTECRNGRSFEYFVLGNTATASFDLACESAWLRELLVTADALGAIAGFLIFGRLSDRHGRRKVLLSCAVCTVLFALLDAFSPVYTVFLIGRLFLGAFDAGIFVSSLVLFIELIPPHLRSYVNVGVGLAFTLPMPILGLLAWLIQDFRYLHLCLALAYTAFVFVVPLVKESPRWLISQGYSTEAQESLEAIIKFNGRRPPNPSRLIEILEEKRPVPDVSVQSTQTLLLSGILSASALALSTDFLSIHRASDPDSTLRHDDPYARYHGYSEFYAGYPKSGYRINSALLWFFICNCFAEVIGSILGIAANHFFNRRITQWIAVAAAACCFILCCALLFGKGRYWFLILALFPRLALHVARYTGILVVTETAPTAKRCSVVGIALACATLVRALSFGLLALGASESGVLPICAMSIAALAGLVWFSRETKNLPLPDSWEETAE